MMDEGGTWMPNASIDAELMGSIIHVVITKVLVQNQGTPWPLPDDMHRSDLDS